MSSNKDNRFAPIAGSDIARIIDLLRCEPLGCARRRQVGSRPAKRRLDRGLHRSAYALTGLRACPLRLFRARRLRESSGNDGNATFSAIILSNPSRDKPLQARRKIGL